MLVRVFTEIFIEVNGRDQAEEACMTIDSSLERQFDGFPHGEVVAANAERYEEVTQAEAEELGLTE